MSKPSAEVVLEGTATWLHGLGFGVGFAGMAYHWLKKQWWYFAIALIITAFHGASSVRHYHLQKKALGETLCENCPRLPTLRLVQGCGAA